MTAAIRQIHDFGPAVGEYIAGSAQAVNSDHLRALFDRVRNQQAEQAVQAQASIVRIMDDESWKNFDVRR